MIPHRCILDRLLAFISKAKSRGYTDTNQKYGTPRQYHSHAMKVFHYFSSVDHRTIFCNAIRKKKNPTQASKKHVHNHIKAKANTLYASTILISHTHLKSEGGKRHYKHCEGRLYK